MRTDRRQTRGRGFSSVTKALLRGLSFVALAGVFSACTTTHPEPVGLQDGAFSSMSYDRELDQTDVVLRSLDETAENSVLKNASDKEIYLPHTMTKSLHKRAEQARTQVKNMASADADSLRTLSIEALVMGQPELVEGYLQYTKSSRKKRKLIGAEDQLLLGLAALLLGDDTKARALLSEAAHDPRTSVVARCNLGLLALRRGAHLEALDLFRQAEQFEPANPRLAHLTAETAYGARKYSAAVDSYKKILSRDKNDVLAHYNLGLVYLYGTRSFKEAKHHFRMVMDHPKASPELRSIADGAFANVRREEESAYGLATADLKKDR